MFDLATFRWGCWREANASALWAAFLDGYRSVRPIGAPDLALVGTFVAIRHLFWTALIVGNVADFGHADADDAFLARQLAQLRRFVDASGEMTGVVRAAADSALEISVRA